MREIKFRAWDGKTMFYCNGLADFAYFGDSFSNRDGVYLMQYTGLKDKNGKEIYEGDIIKSIYQPMWRLGDVDGEARVKEARREQIGIVEHDNCNPCFVINGIDFKFPEYDFICCNLRTNEIIGNIYDNPELLTNK